VKLPLDVDGVIDALALTACPRRATVCRFWPSEPDQWGYAVLENGNLRLFSGRYRRYLAFADDTLAVGVRASISLPDGEREEFRICSIKSP
jgi:hypothetical protein